MEFFPAELPAEENGNIGMPDVTDGGGVYAEYNFDGIRKFWLLDNLTGNVPEPYRPFIKKVHETVSALRDK